MSLKIFAAAGALAGLLQLAFLMHFAAPLAEKLHDALAAGEAEEGYAWWAGYLVASLSGALWGVVLSAFARRFGLFKGAALAYLAFSLLPGLKWLPTPHGVSYVEDVVWREAVHGLYLLFNGTVVWLSGRARGAPSVVAAAALLATGFFAFPSFTLSGRFLPYLPELLALQAVAVFSWALFWAALAVIAYVASPLRRPWRWY